LFELFYVKWDKQNIITQRSPYYKGYVEGGTENSGFTCLCGPYMVCFVRVCFKQREAILANDLLNGCNSIDEAKNDFTDEVELCHIRSIVLK
jgi:hypothetical protein